MYINIKMGQCVTVNVGNQGGDNGGAASSEGGGTNISSTVGGGEEEEEEEEGMCACIEEANCLPCL